MISSLLLSLVLLLPQVPLLRPAEQEDLRLCPLTVEEAVRLNHRPEAVGVRLNPRLMSQTPSHRPEAVGVRLNPRLMPRLLSHRPEAVGVRLNPRLMPRLLSHRPEAVGVRLNPRLMSRPLSHRPEAVEALHLCCRLPAGPDLHLRPAEGVKQNHPHMKQQVLQKTWQGT
jgi:hypothetical protein